MNTATVIAAAALIATALYLTIRWVDRWLGDRIDGAWDSDEGRQG